MQRSIIITVVALIALALLVRLTLPMVSHSRELYFSTFASSPFPAF